MQFVGQPRPKSQVDPGLPISVHRQSHSDRSRVQGLAAPPLRPTSFELENLEMSKNFLLFLSRGSKFKLKRSGFGMFQYRVEYSRPPESSSPKFQLRAGARVRLDVETWCPPASQPASAGLQRLESRPGEPFQNRWVVLVPVQLHNLHTCKFNLKFECQCYTLESIQNIVRLACSVLWTPNLNLSAWGPPCMSILRSSFPDKKSCYILSDTQHDILVMYLPCFISATTQCHWPYICIYMHASACSILASCYMTTLLM